MLTRRVMAVELEKRLGEEERKDELTGFRNMYEAMVRTGAATHTVKSSPLIPLGRVQLGEGCQVTLQK